MLTEAVEAALERLAIPHDGEALHIVVNDPTRATPTGQVLDTLCALRPGLALDVTVACGTHRQDDATRAAHLQRHGLDRARSVRWSGPDADTPIPDALPVLGVGSVEPHWFAGWTGAHKTLTIGIWGRDRIERNHALALSPDALPCVADGNPVFDAIAHALQSWSSGRKAPVAAVNLVADGRGLHAVAGGSPLGALRRVLDTARTCYTSRIAQPLDRLIARVEPPLDHALYQASKGVKNSSQAVRDGGAIVLVASCSDGIGINHFAQALAACPTHADTLERVETDGYRLGDHKAVRLRHLTDVRGIALALVSRGISTHDARLCGFRRFDTEDEARAWAQRVAPGDAEHVLEDAAQRVLLTDSSGSRKL